MKSLIHSFKALLPHPELHIHITYSRLSLADGGLVSRYRSMQEHVRDEILIEIGEGIAIKCAKSIKTSCNAFSDC